MERNSRRTETGGRRGSMTVEAALLMSVLLPVLLSLILAGFLIHDRAVMQGMACEVAAMGSNLTEEADRVSRLQALKSQLDNGRLLWIKHPSAELSVDESRISISYQGNFAVPGMISAWMGKSQATVAEKWSGEILHPADRIWKIIGVKHLIQTIKE